MIIRVSSAHHHLHPQYRISYRHSCPAQPIKLPNRPDRVTAAPAFDRTGRGGLSGRLHHEPGMLDWMAGTGTAKPGEECLPFVSRPRFRPNMNEHTNQTRPDGWMVDRSLVMTMTYQRLSPKETKRVTPGLGSMTGWNVRGMVPSRVWPHGYGP
ncbi:hypothetical protein BO70DRAFT_179410 [Aspergillus heteromorphus CBS 117.55]|uniref:Uncharacterized protein n=1 Tax=Aspergillus heteromorphus CBS 117.55 TaxID=1448321 RepID=A0A317WPA3_9EURO|nr:uncharacterized protein BO70DRAFT_179410 [Aspergillus heteromorphus CBS 117.55]PWY88334.1 hypothetical protein BO70DRAFT_179410 [Aspergillus heteromorphus CBS 117.55]